MTSKERVLVTLNNQEADRVPINFVGTNPDIERRLMKHFGLLPNDTDGLLDALKVDFRFVHAPYVGRQLHAPVEGAMWIQFGGCILGGLSDRT